MLHIWPLQISINVVYLNKGDFTQVGIEKGGYESSRLGAVALTGSAQGCRGSGTVGFSAKTLPKHLKTCEF